MFRVLCLYLCFTNSQVQSITPQFCIYNVCEAATATVNVTVTVNKRDFNESINLQTV